MIGPIRTPSSAGAPSFVVAAWRDDFLKTNLQQVQVIKGWVAEDGSTKEQVYTVAGDAGSAFNAEASIDPATCKAKPNLGKKALCSVWTDPDFDPSKRAVYYARVFENPSCRWSTRWSTPA